VVDPTKKFSHLWFDHRGEFGCSAWTRTGPKNLQAMVPSPLFKGTSTLKHRPHPRCVACVALGQTTPMSKKQDILLLPITLPNVDRFSKFFHQQSQQ